MNIVLEPGASALLDALHRADFAALRPTTGTSAPPPARSR